MRAVLHKHRLSSNMMLTIQMFLTKSCHEGLGFYENIQWRNLWRNMKSQAFTRQNNTHVFIYTLTLYSNLLLAVIDNLYLMVETFLGLSPFILESGVQIQFSLVLCLAGYLSKCSCTQGLCPSTSRRSSCRVWAIFFIELSHYVR